MTLPPSGTWPENAPKHVRGAADAAEREVLVVHAPVLHHEVARAARLVVDLVGAERLAVEGVLRGEPLRLQNLRHRLVQGAARQRAREAPAERSAAGRRRRRRQRRLGVGILLVDAGHGRAVREGRDVASLLGLGEHVLLGHELLLELGELRLELRLAGLHVLLDVQQPALGLVLQRFGRAARHRRVDDLLRQLVVQGARHLHVGLLLGRRGRRGRGRFLLRRF